MKMPDIVHSVPNIYRMTQIDIVGIDYSLTSPGLTVYTTDDLSAEPTPTKCKHFFLSPQKRFELFFEGNIEGDRHIPWESDQERYANIAQWVINIVNPLKNPHVFLEGYSYGSTGLVFNIAENTGILKYRLWLMDIPIEVIAPSKLKKASTGNGNASKDLMYESYQRCGGLDIRSSLTPKSGSTISPISDIVDSFFVMRYGWDLLRVQYDVEH